MIGQAEFLAEVVNMNGIQVIYKQFYLIMNEYIR